MAAIDVLNMSNVDHQPVSSTSSEILQNMVAGAVARSHSPNYSIKLEPDENEEVQEIVEKFEPSTPNSFINSVTKSLFPPLTSTSCKLNNGSPLITTNGIARIPTELTSPSTSSVDEKESKPINYGSTYLQQVKKTRTRIVHNPCSTNHPLSVCRPSSRHIHIECTVHVPKTSELPRSSTTGTKSPPTSPLFSNKRSSSINFATWLSDHFKIGSLPFQQHLKGQQPNQPRPIPHQQSQPNVTTSKTSVIQKDSSSSATKPTHSLPDFLVQFTKTPQKTPTSSLISAARTVEIPANEDSPNILQKDIDFQLNNRKSQRLMDKTDELRNRQVMFSSQSTTTDQRYRELKGELSKIRKQMIRDRTKILNECHKVRQDFQSFCQTMLELINSHQDSTSDSPSLLNGKRHCTEAISEAPSPKRSC
ncbi:hypothetical protein M3Y97_00170700 [Aphelenchoides bicaudatus]|nr:hypothetical protein M3Y97_00170700 [Aphelenchoides bicaudatus]